MSSIWPRQALGRKLECGDGRCSRRLVGRRHHARPNRRSAQPSYQPGSRKRRPYLPAAGRNRTRSNSGPKTPDQWFNVAAFALPAPYTYGSSGQLSSSVLPDVITGISRMQKDFRIREGKRCSFAPNPTIFRTMSSFDSFNTPSTETASGRSPMLRLPANCSSHCGISSRPRDKSARRRLSH